MITPGDADDLARRVLPDGITQLGVRHIEHARRVAVAVADHGDRAVVAALLHETVQKGCIAWPELVTAVDDGQVVRVVDALTRRTAESEVAYLRRCAQDPVAAIVKRIDLLEELVADEVAGGYRSGGALRREARDQLATLHRLIDEAGAAGGV
jgi:(p)ppGpp synthase/HD superfamily hydrolase